MIKKFTFMCYSRKCNVVDRIKMRNKTSLWHDLLAYLQTSDSFLNAKIKLDNDENNCDTTDPVINYVVRHKLKAVIRTSDYQLLDCSNIPVDFYNPLINETNYILDVMENFPLRLLTFLKIELNQYIKSFNFPHSTPLSRYLNRHNFVEVYLDNILKGKDDSKIPYEIFCCENIKVLSLRHNFLRQIPCAIGRLTKLEVLVLTENWLTVQSIPFSLTFCKKLKELYVDNNQLEALPGFLQSMPSLELVYRLGNRNYFKSFFLWHHADYDHRVRHEIWKNSWIRGEPEPRPTILPLMDLSIEKIFSSGINFFNEDIPESLKYYMSLTYLSYNICNFCNKATYWSILGYSTVTFMTPYLGNTCVPFQHWACSSQCVKAIEQPAKKLELEAGKRTDKEYSNYVESSKAADTACNSRTRRSQCSIS